MTGALANGSRCPVCGGRMQTGMATIPFMFPETVVLIKAVPAEICRSCHEPFMVGQVTDRILQLLNQARALPAEVSIIAYHESRPAPLVTTVDA